VLKDLLMRNAHSAGQSAARQVMAQPGVDNRAAVLDVLDQLELADRAHPIGNLHRLNYAPARVDQIDALFAFHRSWEPVRFSALFETPELQKRGV
jgi:hypothetical protein